MKNIILIVLNDDLPLHIIISSFFFICFLLHYLKYKYYNIVLLTSTFFSFFFIKDYWSKITPGSSLLEIDKIIIIKNFAIWQHDCILNSIMGIYGIRNKIFSDKNDKIFEFLDKNGPLKNTPKNEIIECAQNIIYIKYFKKPVTDDIFNFITVDLKVFFIKNFYILIDFFYINSLTFFLLICLLLLIWVSRKIFI